MDTSATTRLEASNAFVKLGILSILTIEPAQVRYDPHVDRLCMLRKMRQWTVC